MRTAMSLFLHMARTVAATPCMIFRNKRIEHKPATVVFGVFLFVIVSIYTCYTSQVRSIGKIPKIPKIPKITLGNLGNLGILGI